MEIPMNRIPTLLVLVPLTACAATGAPIVQPLKDAKPVEVHYGSRLSGAAGTPALDAPPQVAADETRSAALVQLSCKLIEMDRADAAALLGEGLRGARTSRGAAAGAIASLESAGAKSVVAPMLVLFDGGRGDLQVVTTSAFVEAFEITESGDSSIGDPVIGSVSEGVSIEAGTSVIGDGSAVRLELRLRACDVLEPIRETSARLPGCDTAVTVQLPLCFVQDVSASADLGPDEALVIGGLPTKREGRVRVAFLSTRVAPPETAAAR
jgi:hypothetical protein